MATLSSRTAGEVLTLNEQLQDLVANIFGFLDVNEDISETQEGLLEQLEVGLAALMEEVETSEVQIALMATDMLQMTLDNASLARALREATMMLEALAEVPSHQETIEDAMATLRREGQAKIDITPTEDELVLRTSLTFDEDVLREAFTIAVHEYVNKLCEGVLTGQIRRA